MTLADASLALDATNDAIILRLLRDRATDRAVLLAALDQLHDAHATIARQREQLQELRDERERYARHLFPEAMSE